MMALGNLITPPMTDYSSSIGSCSASSFYGLGLEAWRAFDGDVDAEKRSVNWATNNTSSGWIRFDFINPIVVNQYNIIGYRISASSPKSWKFEGSNDGNTWTTLDTKTNETNWLAKEKRIYSISNNLDFKIYRLNISSNNGSAYVGINELELYGQTYSQKYLIQNKSNDELYSIHDTQLIYLSTTTITENLFTDAINNATKDTLKQSTFSYDKVMVDKGVLGSGKIFSLDVDNTVWIKDLTITQK